MLYQYPYRSMSNHYLMARTEPLLCLSCSINKKKPVSSIVNLLKCKYFHIIPSPIPAIVLFMHAIHSIATMLQSAFFLFLQSLLLLAYTLLPFFLGFAPPSL